MEFRLTYEGPLRAANSGKEHKPSRKSHKHAIRQVFHRQLKTLWETTSFLRAGGGGGPILMAWDGPSSYERPAMSVDELARKHALYGYNFVPLVTSELGLMCGLDILYLRRSKPGDVLQFTGDIDNRLKTLFDALQIPDANQGYTDISPGDDEKPFFVLLENDSLVTKVSVETDRLLQDVVNPEGDTENDARLVVTVRVRPYNVHVDNLHFA